MMCKAFGNACAGNDSSAGRRVLQCVMMPEDYAEMFRHGIQSVGFHIGEEPSANPEAVSIVEFHWRQFIQGKYAAQMRQIKGGVVDDHAIRRKQHSLQFRPDASEVFAIADIPIC